MTSRVAQGIAQAAQRASFPLMTVPQSASNVPAASLRPADPQFVLIAPPVSFWEPIPVPLRTEQLQIAQPARLDSS